MDILGYIFVSIIGVLGFLLFKEKITTKYQEKELSDLRYKNEKEKIKRELSNKSIVDLIDELNNDSKPTSTRPKNKQ